MGQKEVRRSEMREGGGQENGNAQCTAEKGTLKADRAERA
jgi:hypothetical protein